MLEQFKLAQQRHYGRSSKKYLIQYDIFDETGVALPDYLPREERVYDIPEQDKTCDCCCGQKTCFGKDVSEQIRVAQKPAQSLTAYS